MQVDNKQVKLYPKQFSAYVPAIPVNVNPSMHITIFIFEQHPEFPCAYVKLRKVVLDSLTEGG